MSASVTGWGSGALAAAAGPPTLANTIRTSVRMTAPGSGSHGFQHAHAARGDAVAGGVESLNGGLQGGIRAAHPTEVVPGGDHALQCPDRGSIGHEEDDPLLAAK